jgi:hypothetical protein
MKRLESLRNTINKYMADIRPDRLTTCQSERKSVVKSTTKCNLSLPFQRTERCDGKRTGKQMTAVTTRWQDVDGQYNSLCATLSINDD